MDPAKSVLPNGLLGKWGEAIVHVVWEGWEEDTSVSET